MTDADLPFAHMRVLAVLEILPMLSRGKAQVFLAVAAFIRDPIAPSVKDLCRYTGIGRPHVASAVEFLCTHHFAHCFVDEEGVRRYRPDARFFHCPAPASVSMREVVPVSGKASESEAADYEHVTSKVTSRRSRRENIQDRFSSEFSSSEGGSKGGTPAQELLLSVGIFSARELDVTDEQAQVIAEALKSGRIKCGFAYTCLKNDPNWRPEPEPKRKTWYGGEYSDFVKR